MNSPDNQPIQTLRISDRDKARLIEAIEASAKYEPDNVQRRLRVKCINNEAILTLSSEMGASTKFSVLGRNLSRWGVSLIHGRYIYPNTRCEVEFQALDGTWHTRRGEVCHVRHVQGLVHELGVRFDHSIDLDDFALLSPDEQSQHLQEMTEDLSA